ncbi:MAG: hypothetical protein KC731_06560 [Myxococcales bacterium]|nr:hypothetical protein [Myxococcales bacterium]
MRVVSFTLRRASRALASIVFASAAACAGIVAAACGSSVSSTVPGTSDAGVTRPPTDAPVVVPDAGPYDAAPPPGTPPSCEKYCEIVMQNCTGDLAQYASPDECKGACAALALGDARDRTDNTVACRQYHAGSPARTDPAQFCPVAGPFGGGMCGDRCTAFCELTLRVCDADAGAARPYADAPACATACANYMFTGAADGGGPTLDGPTDGDTLDCRMFHARSAILEPGQHCAATAEQSLACK